MVKEKDIKQHQGGSPYGEFTKSFIWGFVSGGAGKYIGHPLDTLKTRMQLNGKSLTVKEGLNKVIQKEGYTGLYKGAVSPVFGTAPIIAVLFAANNFSERVSKNLDMNEDLKRFLNGCFAGLCSWAFYIPIELLKIKKQCMKKEKLSYFQVIQKILHEQGPRGLFQGYKAALWRYVVPYGLYFYLYDTIPKVVERNKSYSPNSSEGNKNLIIKIISGGIAGQVMWLTGYPFDVIKSYNQYHPECQGLVRTAKTLYKEKGASAFYKGLRVTLLRAFPVNATTLVLYDVLRNQF